MLKVLEESLECLLEVHWLLGVVAWAETQPVVSVMAVDEEAGVALAGLVQLLRGRVWVCHLAVGVLALTATMQAFHSASLVTVPFVPAPPAIPASPENNEI